MNIKVVYVFRTCLNHSSQVRDQVCIPAYFLGYMIALMISNFDFVHFLTPLVSIVHKLLGY